MFMLSLRNKVKKLREILEVPEGERVTQNILNIFEGEDIFYKEDKEFVTECEKHNRSHKRDRIVRDEGVE